MAILQVPQSFSTIQAAVTAAQQGDIVLVENGVYNEEVVVNNVGQTRNRIQIIARESNAVLYGGRTLNVGFFLNDVDVVEIKGFKIRNYVRAGIMLSNGEDNKIVRNRITNIGTPLVKGDGILIDSSVTNIFWENEIATGRFGSAGIRGTTSTGTGNRFVDNRLIKNPDFGIILQGASASIFVGNCLLNNGTGLRLSSASDPLIVKNKASYNNEIGIHISAASNMSLIENEVENNGGDGVRSNGTGDALVAENKIASNGGRGLDFSGNNFGVIEENNIKRNNGDGIFITSSNNSLIRNEVRANFPFDINLTNLDNNLVDNECRRSNPPGLCNS